MVIEILEPEYEMLRDLVSGRIHEIHSEIRRSMFYSYREKLKSELAMWQLLRSRLEQAQSAEDATGVGRPGLHHPEP